MAEAKKVEGGKLLFGLQRIADQFCTSEGMSLHKTVVESCIQSVVYKVVYGAYSGGSFGRWLHLGTKLHVCILSIFYH